MSLLSAERLTLGFGGVKAVQDLSFSVEAGEVFSIVGPNGAGKTTVFNLISRIHDPDQGTILFDGQDITKVPAQPSPNWASPAPFRTPSCSSRRRCCKIC